MKKIYFIIFIILLLLSLVFAYFTFMRSYTAQAACTSSVQTRTISCSAEQVGTRTQTRQSSCPGPVWTPWTTTVANCSKPIATASNTYAGFPASNTLDKDEKTVWNSGGFADQWIEYDLMLQQTLSKISITSSQYPNGFTELSVYAGATPNPTTLVKKASGFTHAGDVLAFRFTPAITNVRYVRIKVSKSPSWVSIGTVRFNEAASNSTFKPLNNTHLQQFGYYASAMTGVGTGNYIAEVAPLSNVVWVSGQTNEEILSKVKDARAQGMGVVLMVSNLFFPWASSNLFTDNPRARFDSLWAALQPYSSSIKGFYIFDEPFMHNARTDGYVTVPDVQLKNNLNWVATYLQSVAPSIPTMAIFSYVEISRPNFYTDLLPRSIKWIGFDCYIAFGPECSDAKVRTHFSNFLLKKDSTQKIILVPDAYWNTPIPPGTDQGLANSFALYKELATNAEVVGMYPFLYPTITSEYLWGAQSLPITKANFLNYYNWYLKSLFE